MLIDASFPGGNVKIIQIQDNHIHFGPDNRDSHVGWFYWCFRIRQAAGQTLHFHPCRKNLLTNHTPAVSTDLGATWQWADKSAMQEDGSFILTIPPDADDWRVCMTIPYTQEHLLRFTSRHPGQWHTETLCTTPYGSSVPLWRIGQPAQSATHRVMLTARHHCCESMANYVIEGLIDAALANDTLGRWWQNNVSLTVVPFVDYDGVAFGDQGKNRHPRDHNRDYAGTPLYPTTAPIQHEVTQQASLGIDAVLDMHCPWIHSKHSEEIYMVGVNDDRHWKETQAFASHIKNAITGPLPYHPEDNFPFGQGWNNDSNFAQGCNFAKWTCKQPGVRLATAFEIPYSLVHDIVMTTDNVRAFGRDLAHALHTYLPSPAVS